MSSVASTISSFKPDVEFDMHNRRTADFHSSIWKDYFLQHASESKELDKKTRLQIETLKKEVTNMLTSATENPLEKVDLIHAICRLGLHYHFEREIEEVLQQIHKNYVKNGDITLEDNNLRFIALLFRLLRQQGFRVLPNVFNKFKDELGSFCERLTTCVDGMLSLYEASHLRVHGEDILDEALTFTSTHLESLVTQLSPFLSAQVNHSLRQPHHKGLPRLEAQHYISIYQQDPSRNENLLTLAKLDFNLLQNLHQKEVGNISKWWKELNIHTKLPFTRDRVVECCFWILMVYFEPQYSKAREMVMKVLPMLSIIDDTYDAYGTIDELELFTKAIERWDSSGLDDLPEYMKLIYRSFLKVYEEIEQEVTKEGRVYSINYAIKECKKFVQAQMTEARWCNNNYIPTADEYLHVSSISSGYPLLTTISYIGMGDIATEDIFKWVTSEPKIVKASTIIARLMDDIVSNEFEQKRGHVASLVECYMRENDVSREEAIHKLQKRVTDAWKDLNEECLRPTIVPMPFLMRILNLSRFMDVIYKDGDNYTNAGGIMKKHIEDVLVHPMNI